MMSVEDVRYSATLAWVEDLVAARPSLQKTTYNFYTLSGVLWVQVQGGSYEAHAWLVAVGGHSTGSKVDSRGVRRQMILGARVCVEVIDDPRKRTEEGKLHLVLAAAVAGIGLAVWGVTHPVNGVTPLGVLGLAAALGVLWVLQATVRGYWRLEHGGKAATRSTVKRTRQSTSTEHFWDAV